MKLPGPDHPITIEPAPGRVTVSVAGRVVADSVEALVLREASYPPVFYIPRRDADLTQFERTAHTTWCPYKGEAAYYSLPAGGDRSINAVWTYETPFPAVAAIAGHLAFYPDRVDAIQERRKDERHRMTLEGLDDVDAGRLIDHRAVQQWADSLGTDSPLPPPGRMNGAR